MKKLCVALNKENMIADNLSTAIKFFVYEVESNIVQKQLVNAKDWTLERKGSFLYNNKIDILFMRDIKNEEFVDIEVYGLEIFINCDKKAKPDDLVKAYLNDELDTNVKEEMEAINNEDKGWDYNHKEEFKYIIPPLNPSINGTNIANEFAFDFSLFEQNKTDELSSSVDINDVYKD